MTNLDENFSYFVETCGRPQGAYVATDDQIALMTAKLPSSFVNFIRFNGFGMYYDGLFRTCDPIHFNSILALVLKADKDLSHRDCSVVGHSAFGDLWVWSTKHGYIKIHLATGMVFSQTLAPTIFKGGPVPKRNPDVNQEAILLLPFEKDDADFSDINDEPMYDRCRDLYGQPEADEAFGFFPALTLAGIFSETRRVENIKRVKAMEHYAILAQLDSFYLTKVGPQGFEAVRPIG